MNTIQERAAVSEKALQPALQVLRRRGASTPEIALVLGSGLGELAELAERAVPVAAAELPGYPESTVQGHRGRLVFGELEGRSVVFVQGRLHYYEGHTVEALTFPVRLAAAAGARRLLVTNAAGGIHPGLHPGTLMFITDHIDMTFAGPLVGAAPPSVGPAGAAYDSHWLTEAERVARNQELAVRRGTYVWTAGPSYETKAEIRAFRRLGGDAVGMSTVPEVLQARRLGMRVLGLSTITNQAAGLSATPLAHEEVLVVGRRVRNDLQRLIRGIIRAT